MAITRPTKEKTSTQPLGSLTVRVRSAHWPVTDQPSARRPQVIKRLSVRDICW